MNLDPKEISLSAQEYKDNCKEIGVSDIFFNDNILCMLHGKAKVVIKFEIVLVKYEAHLAKKGLKIEHVTRPEWLPFLKQLAAEELLNLECLNLTVKS